MSGAWQPLPTGEFTGIDWSAPGAIDGQDPYLAWAEADHFSGYRRRPGKKPPKWLPIVIELSELADVPALVLVGISLFATFVSAGDTSTALRQSLICTVLLVLSDRDISADTLPIPAAMAVGAVQRTLVDNNLRCDANILVETASVRDPHHFAVLLGFGATAIYPYLAYETLAKQVEEGVLKMSLRQAMLNYRNGINKGLYKVMSKMGISTVASYRCSQLFEAVGLEDAWVAAQRRRLSLILFG